MPVSHAIDQGLGLRLAQACGVREGDGCGTACDRDAVADGTRCGGAGSGIGQVELGAVHRDAFVVSTVNARDRELEALDGLTRVNSTDGRATEDGLSSGVVGITGAGRGRA